VPDRPQPGPDDPANARDADNQLVCWCRHAIPLHARPPRGGGIRAARYPAASRRRAWHSRCTGLTGDTRWERRGCGRCWGEPERNAATGPATGRGGAPPAEPTSGRFIKDGNFELLDQWNTIEVIWQGDRAAHIVNGRTVNVATRLQQPDPQNPGQFIPLTRGKIAIEIEYAEIWFRRIEVKAI